MIYTLHLPDLTRLEVEGQSLPRRDEIITIENQDYRVIRVIHHVRPSGRRTLPNAAAEMAVYVVAQEA